MNKVKIILSSLTVMMMFLIMTEVKADIAFSPSGSRRYMEHVVSARLGGDNHLIITFDIKKGYGYEYLIKSYDGTVEVRSDGVSEDGIVEETIQHKALRNGETEWFVVQVVKIQRWIETRYGRKQVTDSHQSYSVCEVAVTQVDDERQVKVSYD